MDAIAGALITREEAKRHLKWPADDDTRIAYMLQLINAASGWVAMRCRKPIRQTFITWSEAGEGPLAGRGTPTLRLPAWPVLAITRLHPDVRIPGWDWYWDGAAEAGSLRFGTLNDWTFDPRAGEIHLHNGWTFPEGHYTRVDAIVGYADGTTGTDLEGHAIIPAPAGFPYGSTTLASLAAAAAHPRFGWDGAEGWAFREKVLELLAWMYRSQERHQQGVASVAAVGLTTTFLENVPVEIREFFDRQAVIPG